MSLLERDQEPRKEQFCGSSAEDSGQGGRSGQGVAGAETELEPHKPIHPQVPRSLHFIKQTGALEVLCGAILRSKVIKLVMQRTK